MGSTNHFTHFEAVRDADPVFVRERTSYLLGRSNQAPISDRREADT